MPRVLTSERLRERVFDAFPVTQPAFRRLLALLDVEASETVPTAAVTLGARSRLLINPAFVAARCETDHDLVMLVLHELFHVALGHTRLFPRLTPAQNWAFDCVINAQLCLTYPQPHWTALFRRCYAADVFPEALLRPPAGWGTEREQWLPGCAGEVHRALYDDRSTSYSDLYALLTSVLDPENSTDGTGEGDALVSQRLLGDHGDRSQDDAPADVLRELRGIVAEWPMERRRSGRDQGGALEQSAVAAAAARAAVVRTIRQALLSVADLGQGMRGLPARDSAPVPGLLPYAPRPQRADVVRQALGSPVLLHPAAVVADRLVTRECVHLYLDVSGSMDACLPVLYAALRPLAGLVHPQVHLFSTVVHDVDLRDLVRGVRVTTGGTDVAPVTGHLLAQHVRRAVLLTDGWVGDVPAEHARALSKRGARCAVVLTANGDARLAAALAARVWRLPRESEVSS
jgi:hypothetical protein